MYLKNSEDAFPLQEYILYHIEEPLVFSAYLRLIMFLLETDRDSASIFEVSCLCKIF